MARSKIVCDILEQCVVMGDLHHALDAGVVTRANVYAPKYLSIDRVRSFCRVPFDQLNEANLLCKRAGIFHLQARIRILNDSHSS